MAARPAPGRRLPRILLGLSTAAATLAALAAATGCSTTRPTNTAGGGPVIQVAAAENFWGSLAAQLGGDRVKVTTIISKPDADPHDYEPTAADARAVASARYVIVNGIGYDPWAKKMIDANPAGDRTVLTVGDLVGVKEGGNPHRWYSPDDVHKVIARIAADYAKLNPGDAGYFAQRRKDFEAKDLSRYNSLISDIKSEYAGTPIGASESIVAPLADGLGLKLITPEAYLDAISEGSDPTAKDKATVDQQIKDRQIKVYVYNSQNSTPDVQAQVAAARSAGIPVATVTETPGPGDASFQDWQARQLDVLAQALAKATGK